MKWRCVGVLLVYVVGAAELDAAEHSPSCSVCIPMQILLENISNSDVGWDGNYLGLKPHLRGVSKAIFWTSDERFIEPLVKLLSDSERDIAAHVLLVELTGNVYRNDMSTWNGLGVELLPNGGVSYDEASRKRLREMWGRWLGDRKQKAKEKTKLRGRNAQELQK